MIKIFFLSALCLAAVSGYPNQSKIINGTLVDISQYPFLAAILLSTDNVSYRQVCGGTIINNRSILTAAHCTFSFVEQQIRIRVGSTYANSGGNVHISSVIINYPNFHPLLLRNDIGIIRVTSAFSFGGNIQVGSIAGPNYNPGDDQVVYAPGWGITASGLPSEELLHVQIRTLSQNSCANIYGSVLQPNMICAGGGGRGICVGDSGGPLVHNNVVVGVLAITTIPCGQQAAIFMRVPSYTDWIQINA